MLEQTNTIALVPGETQRSYIEIEVDGELLSHHFVGRLGAHPGEVSPLAWSTASCETNAETVAELLGAKPSALASGRVPVLVCEECGDIGCGAYCVRIVREPECVRWTDWAYEDACESHTVDEWPERPGDFCFDRHQYEQTLRDALTKHREMQRRVHPAQQEQRRQEVSYSRPAFYPRNVSDHDNDEPPVWMLFLGNLLDWDSKGSWTGNVLTTLAMATMGAFVLHGLYGELWMSPGVLRGFVAWLGISIFYSKAISIFTCTAPIAAGILGFCIVVSMEVLQP